MTVHQPIQTASVSKMITGVAVLRAIENSKGAISLTDPVFPYLASLGTPDWKFKKIRIHDCLQYRAGIPGYAGGGGDYDLQSTVDWVTKGKHLASDNKLYTLGERGETVQYNNACFALFRIALFYMTATPEMRAAMFFLEAGRKSDPKTWRDSLWHLAVSRYYENWVKKNVFQPGTWANLNPQSEGYNTSNMTWYYLYPATSGQYKGDDTLNAGGTGWYMSANDLAAFWYNLSYGNLLSGDNRSKIFDVQPLGHPSYILDPGVWFEDLYWKKRVISKGGLVERQCSYIVQFPNGAQLTFLSNYDLRGHDTNKEKGYNPSLELAITDAYAQSWKAKKVGTEPC